MISKSSFAAIGATVYLLAYLVFLQSDLFADVSAILFALSPAMLVWLTITVIRYGTYKGKELGEDEWGYQDFPDKELL